MEAQTNSAAPKGVAREQKFLRFRLLPDDDALIAMLPPEQQAVLRSHGSYAKRAEEFGVAIGTIRSRLHRAREALTRLRAERDADLAATAEALRAEKGLH
ncbi:MAG TPA: sigma factor-like helix-turn-helix DNA-binding protein [Rhizomicrobium sp.]|jgi:DNA-directed RNA polymerase specialized sigma24 family protein